MLLGSLYDNEREHRSKVVNIDDGKSESPCQGKRVLFSVVRMPMNTLTELCRDQHCEETSLEWIVQGSES